MGEMVRSFFVLVRIFIFSIDLWGRLLWNDVDLIFKLVIVLFNVIVFSCGIINGDRL